MRIAAVLVTAAVLALPAARQAMTRSDAVALANAVNLVGSDMPGYTESPPESTGGSDPFARCAGSVPSSRALADVASATFDGGTAASIKKVTSDVEVL